MKYCNHKYIYQKQWMIFLILLLTASFMLPTQASENYTTNERNDIPESNGDTYEYIDYDEDGNMNIVYLPEVEETTQEAQPVQAQMFSLPMMLQGNAIETYQANTNTPSSKKVNTTTIKHGVVDFHTKKSNENTSFTYEATGTGGYLNGSYAKDGAFLGYCDTDKTKVRFKQAGVVGCVNASDVKIIDIDEKDVDVSYYLVKNGKINHVIQVGSSHSSSLQVGPMQSYMKEGATYYSYDGHYFYLSYNTMLDDYKENVYTHAINPNQPYYSYFQYLSNRTKTTYTAAQLDRYIEEKTPSDSKLRGMGKYFVEYQNTYGANAVLMLATAINESGWGTSDIAKAKNNLFGHRAYDTSPGLSADAYPSPQASILDHAKNYISKDYLDPKDAGGKYYGSSLGDKATGMNVKYASDPYWGEKAALHSYTIDQYLGNKDFAKYEIGIKTDTTSVNVRSNASVNSNVLYQSGSTISYPVVILGEKKGDEVSGNTTWFKIQSDPTLNSDRSAMTQDVCVYDFKNAYGYISSYYVKPVKYTNVESGTRPSESVNIITTAGFKNSGGYVSGIAPETKVSDFLQKLKATDKNARITLKASDGSVITSGFIGTAMTLTINQNGVTSNYNLVVYGDVNGDGKIMANDYVFIRNHIMETKKLEGAYLISADVNRDNKILANDYVFIRNYIMGTGKIVQ